MQVLQNRLLNRLMERLPDYISLILVILCGFLLARITWMMFPAEPPPPATIILEFNTAASSSFDK